VGAGAGADGYADNTVRAYQNAVRSLASWLAEHHPEAGPTELERQHVRGWLVEVRERRHAPPERHGSRRGSGSRGPAADPGSTMIRAFAGERLRHRDGQFLLVGPAGALRAGRGEPRLHGVERQRDETDVPRGEDREAHRLAGG
jgi:Phage integrase, N-terminal SAM-like domain